MLFNKNDNGIIELKEHLGFLYASNNFDNIKTELDLAEKDIQKIVGKDVIDAAQTHYSSSAFEKESPSESEQLLDDLVHNLQLPIALYAYIDFAPTDDLIHDTLGRRAAYEEDTQIAREWQINKEEQALLNRANRSVDALLEFLDENADDISAWKDSDNYTKARAAFLSSAEQFQNHFPIDSSRRFFITILPFILQAEKSEILPTLGKTDFDTLKAAWQERTADGEDLTLIQDYLQPLLAHLAMKSALGKLPVKALPSGVVQLYTSDRNTIKASQAANSLDRQMAMQQIQKEITIQKARLYEYQHQKALLADPTIEEETTEEKPLNNYGFRV